MEMPETEPTATKRQVWNAGRTVGAKRALKPKQIWEIRFYLNQRRRLRDRALFDLAIDSKLRGCDLVQMKIRDVVSGGQNRTRAIVMQQKTGRPVQFELLPDARANETSLILPHPRHAPPGLACVRLQAEDVLDRAGPKCN